MTHDVEEPASASGGIEGWSRGTGLTLAIVVVAEILIRLLLLPTEGLRDDIDQFVLWVHHIATNGLPNAYDESLAFGPVMAYIWGALGAVQPAFGTVTDASDPGIRALMKLPASIADVGIAALVVFALGDRPRWAVVAGAAILLHPAVFYVSAWWGQYESIFLLSGLGAVIAAINRRNGVAAALVAASLMTKPQAIPFLIPFAAWFWATGSSGDGARGGASGLARAAIIGLAVIVLLWLPFIPAGGPANYLAGISRYQNDVFNVLSARAWNPWWLLQGAVGGGEFIADDVAFVGPIALRHVGYLVAGGLSLVIAAAIVRDPRPERLIVGLGASVLVVFTFMTQMHERYAYAALILLVPLLADPRVRWLWLAFGVVFTLNLIAAVPFHPAVGAILPVDGPVGVVGSILMTVTCLSAVALTRHAAIDRRTPFGTSGDSAATTVGA